MKKIKTYSFNLLLLILLLSVINVSFAKPMSIEQQTTGEFADKNKEFIYYIQTNNAYIDESQENVERIKNVQMTKCNCGYTVFSIQENVNDLWKEHRTECRKNSVFNAIDIFKITLKDGESITINTINANPTIYIVQGNGYSISYSMDEKNFINYKDSESIITPETTTASFKFTPEDDGTLTLRRSQPYIPMTITQRTTGEFADVDKDFTYYIPTNHAHINLNQGHLEEIETSMKKCSCGFTIFSFQENANDIFEEHSAKCEKEYTESDETLNKITLKNGEKIELNAITSNPIIYTEQGDEYLISHSTDGKNFSNYINDKNICLSEKAIASVKFTPEEGKTLTLRKSFSYAPNTGINTTSCVIVLMPIMCLTIALIIRNYKKRNSR